MANISSFSVLEKLNSVPSCSETPSAPIFKTPSPFWNQESVFRRPRHVREPIPDALTLYPYRYPEFSCPAALNQIYPSLNEYSMNPNVRYPTSKVLTSDPTYYWSYYTSEGEDGRAKGFINPRHTQHQPFLTPYYYSGNVLPRDSQSEKIKPGLQKKRAREDVYWHHGPHKKRKYGNNDIILGYLHAESNKNNHQQLNLNQSTYEESEDGGNQTSRELLHPDGSNDAESQPKISTCSESSSSVPCVLYRFLEGSLVELQSGRLKRVEDLQMEDLEQCAEQHPELTLERFTVLMITASSHTSTVLLHVEVQRDRSQLSLEASEGLPFFVCGRGWSSCNPRHTRETCRLKCHQLKVGDVCLAVTRETAPVVQPANPSPDQASTHHTLPIKEKSRKRHFTAPELREHITD